MRLVISGKRMDVYVNGRTEPSLRIAHLEGDVGVGTIAFEGTACYANLTLAPGATDDLDPKAPVNPAAGDHRYLVRWLGTDLVSTATTGHLSLANMPPSSSGWSPVVANDGGLVN